MRTVAWWLVGSLTLVVMGCSGGGTSSPTAPSTTGSSLPSGDGTGPISVSGSLGTAIQKGDLQTSALAIYTVDVNTETLTATSRLKETRSGQANDDLYMLSIDSFLTAGSFKISSVAADADSVDLGYVVTHPFPAPSDPTGTPNGSTNRADLGISGMVLFLADVPSATGNTYFTDRVANTELVANADAYFSPGGLLTTTGNANTYPYRQLVDEVADSRDGISNGGNVDGNFGADGWTRSEFGAGNNGWTGGGVLHGGQASKNTVSLDKDALAGGFSLDVAIIAKYGDPRGGTTGAQKKANRLPPATADASLFAYRLPHNSLDGASISFAGASGSGFIANTISDATLYFHVTDPDARATETTEADLSDDASFTTVAVGEAGVPTVEVCIPGVLGDATVTAPINTVQDDDSGFGGDAGQDSGNFGDPLFFCESVTKAAGTGETAGDFTGMVRVTDPETGLVIGLDGTLAPLASPPDAVTYQAFTIAQLPDNAAPTAVVTLTSADPMNSGTSASLGITSMADADGDNLDVLVDWGDGGGFVSVASGLVGPAYPDQTPSGPQMNNADLVVDTINMVVRITDGTTPTDYPVDYDLGPNRAPEVTGTPALTSPSVPPPATFNMGAGSSTAIDPEGDAVSYTITNNVNSDVVSFGSFPNAANTTAMGTPGPVTFTVYANDALHATTSGTAYPTVAGTIGCPAPGAAAPSGSSIAGFFTGFSGTIFLSPNWFYWGGQDFSGWKTTAYPGWLTQWDDGTVRSAFARVNFTAPATVSATQVNITGWTGNNAFYQIETNTNNRIFWTATSTGNYVWQSSGPSASSIYAGATYPQAIYWADYTGAASVTFNTISTAPNRVMAMTVTHAGDIIYIDQNSTLRKISPTGASTYAESTACGFPANLGVGSTILPALQVINPAGIGDANRKVHDLVVDENNGAILLLVQSQQAVVLGNGNGLLYRIERDLTYSATVNGNANPRRFVLNTTTTQSMKADINIDNYNSSAALLTGQQDNQIITSTSGNGLAGDNFDVRIWRSDLSLPTVSLDTSIGADPEVSRQLGMDAIGNRLMVTTGSYDVMGWYTGAPAGWQ